MYSAVIDASFRPTVGIATYHASLNEGAVVQAFATRAFLEDHLDADVRFAGYRPLKRWLLHRSPLWSVANKREIAAFARALPSEGGPDEASARRFLNERCSLAVFGSDEVWRFPPRNLPSLNTLRVPNLYFGSGVTTPRAAYAVSIGQSDPSLLGAEIRRRLAGEIDRFRFLGVRDERTAEFVTGLSPSFAQRIRLTPDPTFATSLPLKDKAWFRSRLSEAGIGPEEQVAVLAPMFRHRISGHVVRELASEGYRVVSLYRNDGAISLESLRLDPLEWFSAIGAADFVVTQRFHGLVAALLGNVPCLTLGERQKVDSLRTRFSLPTGTIGRIAKEWDRDHVERVKGELRAVHRSLVDDLRRAAE